MGARRLGLMAVIIIIFIFLDQYTKHLVAQNFYLGEVRPIIDGFFNLTHVRNTGAAFGFGAGSSDWFRITFFLALPVIACVWLLWAIWKTAQTNLLMCVAYTLVFAGAVGNLIDRFRLRYVVDFFDFYHKNYHFAAFNIADSCITIAAFLIIFDYFKEMKKEKIERAESRE